VTITVTNRDQCLAVDIGVELALTLQRLYPDNFDLER